MPTPSLPPEALVDLRHRLSTLPSRSAARRQVIQEVAAVYAVSEATVYRALQRRPSPRAIRRVDRGTPKVLPVDQLERYCEVIAALKLRTTNKKGRHLSTAEAIRLLEVYGVETPQGVLQAPPAVLKKSTVNYYLNHWGIDWRRLRREPPAVRFQAQHSNELWQFDISPSDLKHLTSPAWVDETRGQPTLMLYSVVDDRSGVAYQEYHCTYGEAVETAFAGLTTKPHCDACAHTIAPRSQAPSAPHRCIVPLRGRRRQVDPSHHTVRHWLVDTAEQLRAFSAYFLCDVHVRQLQLDEVYAVLRDVKTGALSEAEVIAHLERSPAWVWSAMDPDSKLLLVSDVGTRTLAMAQRVVHQVVQVLAPHCIPLCVTDGLKDDGTAFLTHCGSWIQPARRRDKGPLPKPRWMPLPELLYAQVVKSYRRRRIVGVTYRVVFGTMERVQQGLSACGRKINTAFAERLNLDLRQRVAAVGRRVNTLCQGEDGLRQQLVVYHASDHFCLPHASLRQPLLVPEPTNGRGSATRWRPCTPAMAASLTDLCGRCARCSCTACRRGHSRRRSE